MPSAPTNSTTASSTNLNVSPEHHSTKPKKVEIADSWEDEIDENSDSEQEVATPVRPSTSDLPPAPPPTPASRDSQRATPSADYASFSYDGAFDEAAHSSPSTKPDSGGESRRPDKTTAVASRLIAAAIGQRPPQRTKEQREYDQAMRLQEKKKREKAKEDEQKKQREKEQAQKSVWDD